MKNYILGITNTMSRDELQEFFENNGFIVYLGENGAELEMWTDGGVDMIINMCPFTKEEFIDYVDNFDIDEEIDLHREGRDYRNAFTITQSVKDFTDYHFYLKEVARKLR